MPRASLIPMDGFCGKIVAARNTSGRLAYNDDGNGNGNFKITYSLSAGQTVYLRVHGGSSWTKTGNYSVRVSKGD